MSQDDEDLVGLASVTREGGADAQGCTVEVDPKVPGKYTVRAAPNARVVVQLKDTKAKVLSIRGTRTPGEHVVRVVSSRSPSEPFNSPLEIAVLKG